MRRAPLGARGPSQHGQPPQPQRRDHPHRVLQFSHAGVTYAKGLVTDERKGRHAPVDLGDEWHRVDRNTEREIQQKPAHVGRLRQAARNFD